MIRPKDCFHHDKSFVETISFGKDSNGNLCSKKILHIECNICGLESDGKQIGRFKWFSKCRAARSFFMKANFVDDRDLFHEEIINNNNQTGGSK